MIHMEGIKGGGGRVGVGDDDIGDGMQCINHPHRNNNQSGICAFCLQEKLGKLVSSSSLPLRPSSSSSPFSSSSSDSPSFTSNTASASASSSSATASKVTSASSVATSFSRKNASDHHYHERHMKLLLPFLLAKKSKKKQKPFMNSSTSSSSVTSQDIIFKRSKSTSTPRRRNQFLDEAAEEEEDEDDDIVIEDFSFSPRKRNSFWSFLYLSSSKPSSSSSSSSSKKLDANKGFRDNNINGSPRISAAACTSREKCSLGSSSLGLRKSEMVVDQDDGSTSSSAFASASVLESKVSRSRSVGCGSRSFSGDFFERISTGFGDCTLRRVESHREGKTRLAAPAPGTTVNHGGHHQCMKARVRCGGIFGGFMMISSSSSSSAASSYWVSSSSADDGINNNGESVGVRGRSWSWALASPMRAFGSKKFSKDNKKRGVIRDASDKNATPNISAIPSLLTVSS